MNDQTVINQAQSTAPKKKYSEFWLVSIAKFIAYAAFYLVVSNVTVIIFEICVSVVMSVMHMSDMTWEQITKLAYNFVLENLNYAAFAGAFITIGLLFLFFLIRRKNPVREMNLSVRKAELVPIAILTGVALNVVLNIVFELLPPELFEEYGEAMSQDGSVIGYLLYAVVAAPVIEELIFRGLGLSRLKRSMPKWAALIITAVLFGVLHLGGHWIQVIYAGFFGLLLGLLYINTDSILLSVSLHFGFNAFSLMGFVDPERLSGGLLELYEYFVTVSYFLCIPVALIGIVMLLLFTRSPIAPQKAQSETEGATDSVYVWDISSPESTGAHEMISENRVTEENGKENQKTESENK